MGLYPGGLLVVQVRVDSHHKILMWESLAKCPRRRVMVPILLVVVSQTLNVIWQEEVVLSYRQSNIWSVAMLVFIKDPTLKVVPYKLVEPVVSCTVALTNGMVYAFSVKNWATWGETALTSTMILEYWERAYEQNRPVVTKVRVPK